MTERRHCRELRLAMLTAAMFMIVACSKGGNAEGDAAETTPTVPARIAVVTTQPFTQTVASIGTVAPRTGHVASLSAPAAARVARVLVSAGQHVQAGQALVELDQSSFQAALQSAEAAVAAAQRSYERNERLAQEGIAPRKDVEQAAAELAKARADLVTARREQQLSILHAPIAGVVTRMTAQLGGAADVAQPLVEIADPSNVDILLNVTPTDAARLRSGMKVTMSAGQSAGGEALGIGNVVDIGGTVDSTTRTVNVRVQAPATRRPLRIGETVFGQIAILTRPNAVVVPNEALVPEGDGFKVFVVDAAGVAHSRPVAIGGRTDRMAEITSGLSAGERVVTYGAYGVEDSAKVVPLDATARPAAPEKP
jgi:membrane fusion protein, multidrug efflux system